MRVVWSKKLFFCVSAGGRGGMTVVQKIITLIKSVLYTCSTPQPVGYIETFCHELKYLTELIDIIILRKAKL